MVKALQIELAALKKQIGAATLSDESKHAATWCCGQLPALYKKLSQTNESRYREDIKRLMQSVLHELAKNISVCPEAPSIAKSITGRFRLFHEKFGIPGLELKMPTTLVGRAGQKSSAR
jgi:hypothetical protein